MAHSTEENLGCFFSLSLLPRLGFLSRDLMCARNTGISSMGESSPRGLRALGVKIKALVVSRVSLFFPILDEPQFHLTPTSPHPIAFLPARIIPQGKGKGLSFPHHLHTAAESTVFKGFALRRKCHKLYLSLTNPFLPTPRLRN